MFNTFIYFHFNFQNENKRIVYIAKNCYLCNLFISQRMELKFQLSLENALNM